MALGRTGKILYSLFFLVLLPVSLAAWASATSRVIPLPLSPIPSVGAPLVAAGLLLLLAGMRDLWVHGGGLPMNAAPPPRYVVQGAYALVPHPIYTGFCMMCAGVSILVGSASGLWLVTPMVMLGCAALVMGYERHDLSERFGEEVRNVLPSAATSRPSVSCRARCLILVCVPWLSVCGAFHLLGGSRRLPGLHGGTAVTTAAVVLCASSSVALVIAPFALTTRANLRTLTSRSLLTLAFACMLFFALPLGVECVVYSLPASMQTSMLLRRLVNAADGIQQADTYFPSFTFIWVLLVSGVASGYGVAIRAVLYLWAVAVAVCYFVVLRGHLLPFLGSLLAVGLMMLSARLWEGMRSACETIANSWKEWHVGPARIISHGLYVGLGGFVALSLGGILAGRGHETAIFVAAMFAVAGAALWAQLIEGSPQMLRPFGFYGGLLGGILGALVAPVFHTSVWLLLAVFAAIGSFGQAFGRLRCLVQGCCHGRPGAVGVGIRYLHPNSRVCRFTDWKGIPLHPTPLYSLLWNGVMGVVIVRLWTLHVSLSLITGMYFMLNGAGRFVEESYRGEPQTRTMAGLRLYQWAAIASFVLGALLTAAPTPSTIAPTPCVQWGVLPAAIAFGVCVGCAMGVDFPRSNHRFSRLA